MGRYTLSTSPQGFKKTILSGIELQVGYNLVATLIVEVGPVSETVNVQDGPGLVETRSANFGRPGL